MSATTVKWTESFIKWTINILFSFSGWIIAWALRLIARLAWWTGRQMWQHPRTSGATFGMTAAVLLLGWETVAAVLLVLLVAGSTWKSAHRASWDQTVGAWVETWWATWWTYRRIWDRTMIRAGLAPEVDEDRLIPRIRHLEHGRYWDKVEIEMVQGAQEVKDFEERAETLRHAFRRKRISVYEVEPGGVGLDLMHRDPLLHEQIVVPAIPTSALDVDLTAIPLGLDEYLQPFRISLVGAHTAVVGTSGSGKASIEWGILRHLTPMIAHGLCDPVFVDPKGIELVRARSILRDDADYVSEAEETLQLFQRLVLEMKERKAKFAARGERDFDPSLEFPLRLIMIDELAPLSAYWENRLVRELESLLSLLLTQGRALGYIIVAEIQEPTKDVFKKRDLFGRRLGLRLPTEDQTTAGMVDNAVASGVLCHQIPDDDRHQGVLYSLRQGASRATRARAIYTDDDAIDEFVQAVIEQRQQAQVVDLDARRRTADDPNLGEDSAEESA